MASLADALAYQQKRQQMLNALNDQPTDLEKAVQDQFGMQPNMDRAALLPYKSKDKGWVAPEAVYQLAKLLASPATALKGGNISNQEAIEAGNTLSGFMTPAGLLSKPSPAMARMNVYHGSPHTFDKFDSSKIGTGEGAQAYGHGLYLAESPEVGKGYQKALAPEKRVSDLNGRMKLASVGNKPLDSFGVDMSQDLIDAAKSGGQPFIDLATQKRAQWADLVGDQTYPFRDYAADKLKAYDSLLSEARKSSVEYTGGGNLYTVDLPDEMIARMLDWYKPLSQQAPEVQSIVNQMLGPPGSNRMIDDRLLARPTKSGGQEYSNNFGAAYNSLTNKDQIGMSQLLRNAGIPGIKYLDAGSRGAATGTSNFVVFPGEEHNLKILKRE